MEILSNLELGLLTAATANNLWYSFLGCLLGTLIGVLPGLGPAATIAMLMPATFTLEPTSSLIMLAGIYYGAQYGGSATAILVNIPGESSSIMTTLDGHQMARQGRAGQALAAAAISSFIAGTIATVLIAGFAPALAKVALAFEAPEYFGLVLLGLVTVMFLSSGSMIKALIMMLVGVALGTVGADVTSGQTRLTLAIPELYDGLNIIAVAMGIYGLGDIIYNIQGGDSRPMYKSTIRSLVLSKQELKAIVAPSLRGTALGSLLGVLPGGGAMLSSFAAYVLEKKISRHPERFGKGEIAGVAAPEAANNAGAQTSFIPFMTIGIPSNVVIALMAGTLLLQGIRPGPSMITEQPQLFWGLVVSMWIGNLILVVLNLPLVGIWVKLLSVRYEWLFPSILVFCCIGVFTVNNGTFLIYVMIVFGVVGYFLRVINVEPAPLLIGMVLGPSLEEYLLRTMLINDGSLVVLFQRPIAATLIAMTIAVVLLKAFPGVRTLLRKVDES
ncbi:MAG: tripartite tricarboxylate transporter permease [Reyranellaceae bacterium]